MLSWTKFEKLQHMEAIFSLPQVLPLAVVTHFIILESGIDYFKTTVDPCSSLHFYIMFFLCLV